MAATVHVVGRYESPRGDPAEGTVTFTPSAAIVDTVARSIVLAEPVTVQLNGQGVLTVDLYSGEDPTLIPANFTYTVQEKIGSYSRPPWTISVPDTHDDVELAWLTPVVAQPAVYDYVLTAVFTAELGTVNSRLDQAEEKLLTLPPLRITVGVPTDADYTATPPDGTMALQPSASKLWARCGGVWKSTTLA